MCSPYNLVFQTIFLESLSFFLSFRSMSLKISSVRLCWQQIHFLSENVFTPPSLLKVHVVYNSKFTVNISQPFEHIILLSYGSHCCSTKYAVSLILEFWRHSLSFSLTAQRILFLFCCSVVFTTRFLQMNFCQFFFIQVLIPGSVGSLGLENSQLLSLGISLLQLLSPLF